MPTKTRAKRDDPVRVGEPTIDGVRAKAIAIETLDGGRYISTRHAAGPGQWLAALHADREGKRLAAHDYWVEVTDGLRWIRFDRVVAVSEEGPAPAP